LAGRSQNFRFGVEVEGGNESSPSSSRWSVVGPSQRDPPADRCATLATMQRPPQQARSIASTETMLDAAEVLIDRSGADAVTVEAVVRTANTSVGSFYARFGDRRGLLVAMQNRFHGRLDEMSAQVLFEVQSVHDLEQGLEVIVRRFLDAFRQHRASFSAYMLQNRSDPEMRAQGSLHRRNAARLVTWFIAERMVDQVTHPDPVLAADFVFRTLSALATQTVLFDDDEITSRRHDPEVWVRETTDLLVRYLQPR
jgi:AcrR family transcriptional regulator